MQNGGCPHMTCSSCKKSFCWYCRSTDAAIHTTFQALWHGEKPMLACVAGATVASVLIVAALLFFPAHVLGLALVLPAIGVLTYLLLVPVYVLFVAYRNERRDRKMRQTVTQLVWRPHAGECGHAFSSDSPFNCVFCNFEAKPHAEAGVS